MKSRNYSPISIDDIYLGELGFVCDFTKYFVGEIKEENAHSFYNRYIPIRHMIFILKDGTVFDKSGKYPNNMRFVQKGYANDLMNGTSNYPVYGKIDDSLIKDNSLVIVKHYSLGELFREWNFQNKVSYDDLTYLANILDFVDMNRFNIDESLKEEILKMRKSRKSFTKQLKPNVNEFLYKVGV